MQKHHGRRLQIDGDLGPATAELLDQDRCDFPDFPVDRLDMDMTAADFESFGTLESNWPTDCRHSVSTGYQFGTFDRVRSCQNQSFVDRGVDELE